MIFNSLGSNYDADFILKSLFCFSKKDDERKLISYLESRYSGRATLLYKGREAIKLALMLLKLPKNSRVGVTGFTCFVVYQAISELGLIPEYIDIEKDSLNFDIRSVEKHKNIKALIIQNTLGTPCDILQIQKYCKKNSIYLIEDLAHSVGSIYGSGKEVGTVGDLVALSFSQDKSIDAVSGGALIIRDKRFLKGVKKFHLEKIDFIQNFKNRLYPFFTFLIRKTYFSGFGKFLHLFLKQTNLLSRPVDNIGVIKFHKLPFWNSKLALRQFLSLEKTLIHKLEIASIYEKKLGMKTRGVLRWPMFFEKRDNLVKFMAKNNIYISDVWYNAPIAPKKFINKTNYLKGDCPNSEVISEQIVNLPTHINLSVEEAKYISEKIKLWETTT